MTDILDRIKQQLTGRYRIERELGRGGMATVYLAIDLKHDRQVALKVLHPEVGASLGAERFLTEIKVTANLQHPHILPLHDSGEADGLLFYVMPYVEGESLRDRLDREHEMAVDTAVELTRQVATALDYAHRHNVIHRDIKPENILLHDGQAVVADFGIALAVRNAGGTRLTETGLSLGTPQYMSPEQAMADREIDARSDVYSLGCVAYEMLAGEAPHSGPNAQAILTKVVTEEAPLITNKRKSVPPGPAAAIHKAIQKLPADRWATAQEFAEALVRPMDGATLTAMGVGPALERPEARRTTTTVSLAVAAISLVVAGWALTRSPATPAASITRFITTFPASEQLGIAPPRRIAVAPDGSGFVYVGTGPDGRTLYERRFDAFNSRRLPGTEGGGNPSYSPDGMRLGFDDPAGIKILDLGDGSLRTIEAEVGNGMTWSRNDQIVFTAVDATGLATMSLENGAINQLTRVDTTRGELRHLFPDHIDDTDDILFTVFTESGPKVAVWSASDETYHYVVEGRKAMYANSGHILFVSNDSLWALRYQPNSGEVSGPPQLLEGNTGLPYSVDDFAVSDNGTLVYTRADVGGRQLVEVDRDGREYLLIPERRGFGTPRYDPTGNRISVVIGADGGFNIWLFDVRRRAMQRLTFENDNFYPAWSPDGSYLVYSRQTGGDNDLYRLRADGAGQPELFFNQPQRQWDLEFGPAGRLALFRQNDSLTGRDLWLLDLTTGQARPYLATPHQERAPKISPDGRLVAYVSDETGRSEIYLRTFPDTLGKWLVSRDGGTEPLWSPDGKELFYRSADKILVTEVDPGPPLTIGTPRIMLEGPYVPNPMHTNYDIHPSGDRLVMLRSGEGERQVVVVQNLFTELNQ